MRSQNIRRSGAAALLGFAILGASLAVSAAPAFADDGTQIGVVNATSAPVTLQLGTEYFQHNPGVSAFPVPTDLPAQTIQPGQSQHVIDTDSSDATVASISENGTVIAYVTWINPPAGEPYYQLGGEPFVSLAEGQQTSQTINGHTLTFTRAADSLNKNLIITVNS